MNLPLAERLTSLNIPFTIAVLPHTTFAKETALLAKSRGKGVIMHLPMEPENLASNDPGPGALLIEMPELLIEEIILKNIESIGEIDGANNHMGSALTSNEDKIRQVLAILSKYTDTYIDSYTSPKSVAYRVCNEIGMKCGINRKFIDNEANQTYIASKIYEAMATAQNNGAMIVIGHLRPDTITVLEYVVPELTNLGYKFIPVEHLIK
jgi:polysaccharide deacetylase 2 family uncharacterized protein YibQ